MRIIISQHAKKRMGDLRQSNIDTGDIIEAALSIPGYIPAATRFRGFVSAGGRTFDIVAKDVFNGRLVITIIGK
ncbi:MAG: hypothetical protein ACOX2P_08815 [Bacillota bacterium]|jgi:hypothetical protein